MIIAPFYVAVDFDGTCVKHEFPNIGEDVPGAVDTLKKILELDGAHLILWTMRSDQKGMGDYLSDAVNWFAERSIPLFGVNLNPSQGGWTASPKAYAHIYIDDAAAGCPLLLPDTGKPYVDWRFIYTPVRKAWQELNEV